MFPFLEFAAAVAAFASPVLATMSGNAAGHSAAAVTQPAKVAPPPAAILRPHRATPHHKPRLQSRRIRHAPAAPRQQVSSANAAARVEPDRQTYFNGIQQYAYADGALYQVYAAPGRVTDIVLQEGEELTGSGPVAAGDTARWIIGDTTSGSGSGAGAAKRVHILVKPTRSDIATNLVINTDRRTYHLELRATSADYMAAISWTYPLDALIAVRKAQSEQAAAAPVAAGIDVAALNFGYRITGDKADWKPVRAFDDGRRVMIEFPESVATSEMPPLFVVGADGSAELVNYRVQGRYMIVDRLFAIAELRIGSKKTRQVVRIERERFKAAKAPRS